VFALNSWSWLIVWVGRHLVQGEWRDRVLSFERHAWAQLELENRRCRRSRTRVLTSASPGLSLRDQRFWNSDAQAANASALLRGLFYTSQFCDAEWASVARLVNKDNVLRLDD
jgi:hypothetical protein